MAPPGRAPELWQERLRCDTNEGRIVDPVPPVVLRDYGTTARGSIFTTQSPLLKSFT